MYADLPYRAEFDAVFSNAVLHWVLPPEAAIESHPAGPEARRTLRGRASAARGTSRPSSRRSAGRAVGKPGPDIGGAFFFPSDAEYAAMLESHGFDVQRADLFERPTPLDGGEDGLRLWLDTFAGGLLDGLSADERADDGQPRGSEARAAAPPRWTVDGRLRPPPHRRPPPRALGCATEHGRRFGLYRWLHR